MTCGFWKLIAALCLLGLAGCGARAELMSPCPPVAGFAGGQAGDCGEEQPINFGRL